jgi:riboflavin synthase
MFSGITQGLYPVTSVQQQDGIHYAIALPQAWRNTLKVGDSIAVDGVCQTIARIEETGMVWFDAMPATCKITTLNQLQVDLKISIEKSLCVGDACGGHMLSGHVHGTATVIDCTQQNGQVDLRIQCPTQWLAYLLPKGYVAINGSSLTIAKIDQDGILTVHLIPETCRLTRLGQLAAGELVNVELDQMTMTIVQTTERILAQRGIT